MACHVGYAVHRRFFPIWAQIMRLWRGWPLIFIIFAPISLGMAVGMLAGLTEADPTVIAAIIPALLAGVGGALFVFKTRGDDNQSSPELRRVCFAVTVFSVSLMAGFQLQVYFQQKEERDKRNEQREYFKRDLSFHRAVLTLCSDTEAYINTRRANANLAPLPSEMFCDIDPVEINAW